MKLNLGCLIALGIFLGLCIWVFIIAVENNHYEFQEEKQQTIWQEES